MTTRPSLVRPLRRALLLCPVLIGALFLLPADTRRAEAQSTDASVVGQWSGVMSWPIVAIHTHVLPNGKLLVWPRDGGAQARVWDPATNTFVQVPTAINLFCSAHSYLPDGRLLVTGGHIADNRGEKTTHIFDSANNSWTRVADMNAGRWYPTNCSLANGEQVVVSGNNNFRVNDLPQVWTGTGWRSLNNAKLGLPLYPFMHLAPNGKVFNSGPGTTTRYLDTAGSGAWTTVASRSLNRDYGASVPYADGKVILIGGGDPPTATCEMIDLNVTSPTWRSVGSMSVPRRQHNAVILPDGKVLVTGGTRGGGFNDACNPTKAAEVWDPGTETWTTLASAAETRIYHSTAVLMPDGRVFTGGGGQPAGQNCPDADHFTVELYSPPYLFNGSRPTISSAPASVAYGQTFSVGTAEASSITNVNWVRLPSTTHTRDMNQRFNRLAFTQGSGSLNVTAPGDPKLCPPGHYMLFILNSNGVPSTAAIIRIS